MNLRLTILTTGLALGLFAQVQNDSNAAYQRYQSLVRNSTAPLADILKAADEWLQTYERHAPDSRSVPPYLILARFYASKGIRSGEILQLLEKGVNELSTPGSFTETRTNGNSPFLDDIERGLAAKVYTYMRLHEKARELLAIAGRTVNETRVLELDPVKVRIFEALRFQYWDGMVHLAIAEGRKEDALMYEHAILTNPKNVASPRFIEEHRKIAQQLWTELGRSDDFQKWLSGDAQ